MRLALGLLALSCYLVALLLTPFFDSRGMDRCLTLLLLACVFVGLPAFVGFFYSFKPWFRPSETDHENQ